MLEVFVREFETYGKNMTLQEVHDCLDEIERIPGFPLITGGIDLAKSHMRSGLERLAYALTIITVATFTGWIVAQFLGFRPGDLVKDVQQLAQDGGHRGLRGRRGQHPAP